MTNHVVFLQYSASVCNKGGDTAHTVNLPMLVLSSSICWWYFLANFMKSCAPTLSSNLNRFWLTQGLILTIPQLYTTIVKTVGTPGQRQLFREKAKQYYSLTTRHSKKGVITQVVALMPVRDIQTCWNLTHAVIKQACILQKVTQPISFDICWQLIFYLGYRCLALQI